jgi:CDGSH-type Zn-finger protein
LEPSLNGAEASHEVGSRRHRRSFWVVAFAFLVVMALGTVPSPLYGLYRARDYFSLFMVTVAFAVYAVGVIVALLLAGHLSDLYGRVIEHPDPMAICRCRGSSNKPSCDGTHATIDFDGTVAN